MRVFPAVALGLVVSVTGSAAEPTNTWVDTAAEGFTFSMPGKPVREVVNEHSAVGDLTSYRYTLRFNETLVGFTVESGLAPGLDQVPAEARERMLPELAKNEAARRKLTRVETHPVVCPPSAAARTCLEMSGVAVGVKLTGLFMLHDDRVSVMTYVRREAEDQPEVFRAFIDRFRLAKVKRIAVPAPEAPRPRSGLCAPGRSPAASAASLRSRASA